MPRLDVLLTGYEITDEIIERTSSTALALGHDTIRGTADLEIWTGAGGTGTQLALTTDYTVSDEDTDLSTEAGVSIYTKLAIVNGTYHNVDLYVTYKTIGDYSSVSTVEKIITDNIIRLVEVSADYTLLAIDETVIITTADTITLTIPEGLPVGKSFKISRTVASTNAVTVARSGSDAIEGGASFVTHGAFAASTLNPAEVVIKQVTAGVWLFVAGIVLSSIAASGIHGVKTCYEYPDGSMDAYGTTDIAFSSASTVVQQVAFPVEFTSPPEFIFSLDVPVSVYLIPISAGARTSTTAYIGALTVTGGAVSGTSHASWHAHGDWRVQA